MCGDRTLLQQDSSYRLEQGRQILQMFSEFLERGDRDGFPVRRERGNDLIEVLGRIDPGGADVAHFDRGRVVMVVLQLR